MRVKIINSENKPKKLRVCAYARVSTNSLDQYGSLENQSSAYERLIKSNPKYEFVRVYHDRGMTGSKAKRTGFQSMIADARKGEFDLIMTKSISRFARNTSIVLEYVRELKAMGIGVFFEEQNINTLSEDGEFMLSVLSSFAQEELRSMSGNIKWNIQKRFKQGILKMDTKHFLGYDMNEYGELTINEEQAKIVRRIFDMYLSGLSMETIVKKLNEENVPTMRGGRWSAVTISGILKNEKYKGDCILQKYYCPEINKKVRNNGNVTSYYIEDNHPAIVSEEIWDKAQQIMTERKAKRKIGEGGTEKYQNRYPLSGMLICPYCGSMLRRKQVHNKRIEWWCSKSITEGVKACKGIHVRDEDAVMQNITEPTIVKETMINGEKHYSYTRKSEFDSDSGGQTKSEKTENGGVLQSKHRQRRAIIKL